MKKNGYRLLVFTIAAVMMSFKINTTEILKKEELIKIDVNSNSYQNGWSTWKTTDCFRGLDLRVKKKPKSNYSEKHEWLVQFRNRYNNKIYFSYEIVPYSEKQNIRNSQRTTNRVDLKGNTTEKSTHYKYLREANTVYVHVNKVRFSNDYGKGYSDCDN
ncbi:hypothetical protein SAMN05216503_1360 [Polaribacter sp. KT25b]|uniref:hypothetical protein n=1 Tax=Polaribacter sp. KT25b TaxID=1855336 RepID=UPI0008794DD9|nr:hypothetical protein [Polaribacter sp. KT25b]SDR91015.1 hypothetical protein SAMN05216503_1360 [Polaribacter sp. KT25b]